MKFFDLFVILIHLIYISCDYQIYRINEKFAKVLNISHNEYFIILNNGIYIYDNNFQEKSKIFEFKGEQIVEDEKDNEKTAISDLKENINYYILCLVKNYLYLYDNNTKNVTQFNLNEKINGYYYNLIPYKLVNNTLEFIIAYISISSYRLNIFHYAFNFSSEIYNLTLKNYYIDNNNFIKSISGTYLSCEIIFQNSFICFLLAENNNYLLKTIFYIEKNWILYNQSITYILQKSGAEINKIKISFDYNNAFLCWEEFDECYIFPICYYYYYYYYCYNYNISEDKLEFLFIHKEKCKNFEVYALTNNNDYIYICNEKMGEIYSYKINLNHLEKKFNYTNINECKNIYNFNLFYKNNEYNLITDCITYNESWKYITSFSIFTESISIPISKSNVNEKKIGKYFNGNKKELIQNLTEIIKMIEIGENYQIIGNDFNLVIKPTYSSFLENLTHVDFKQCEEIIRNSSNISNSRILTFLQLEIKNTNEPSLVNQLEYQVLDDNKNILNLSICNDTNIEVFFY